jgi:hypothetical protein
VAFSLPAHGWLFSYKCWYNPEDTATVVMDTRLGSIFWTGFGIAVAVFVFCIALPLFVWCFVTARRMPYPDRMQVFAQNRLMCCCKKRSDLQHSHASARNDTEPALLPAFEKHSIEIPMPSFTTADDKLHRG